MHQIRQHVQPHSPTQEIAVGPQHHCRQPLGRLSHQLGAVIAQCLRPGHDALAVEIGKPLHHRGGKPVRLRAKAQRQRCLFLRICSCKAVMDMKRSFSPQSGGMIRYFIHYMRCGSFWQGIDGYFRRNGYTMTVPKRSDAGMCKVSTFVTGVCVGMVAGALVEVMVIPY